MSLPEIKISVDIKSNCLSRNQFLQRPNIVLGIQISFVPIATHTVPGTNSYSDSHMANVLFLESPAGVGFSYSNTTKDYSHNGDTMTAQDNLVFLVNWLERFPEYKGREFYMAGESYASHYIPQLAQAILAHNHQNKGQDSINLKGIMLGNAVLNDDTDTSGMYDFFWTHALISDSTIDAIYKTCNLSLDSGGPTCTALDDVDSDIGNLDIYNIYAPLCTHSGTRSPPKTPSIENFDPCSDYYVEAYLNTPEVQEAMHANVTKLKQRWSSCSDVISSWGDTVSTVLPILTELLSKGTRIWVYSGDVDGRIPITSTRYSLNQLQLPVKIPWGAWYLNNQVGGFSTTYEGNLTLVTVRGAGHEVPSYQPARSLMLEKGLYQVGSGTAPADLRRPWSNRSLATDSASSAEALLIDLEASLTGVVQKHLRRSISSSSMDWVGMEASLSPVL
ncbi:hypothetical protein LUZ61_001814 [Rhynchospora tenuis]|uniref:Carboxypeptidase n=1 Tax=Rhynchospora tenuis TaxID=198213 RepID=A0AAD6ER58_9POAL|nr:hypothetical protein LUZ61_001814 [Rhynchospora tenuis]